MQRGLIKARCKVPLVDGISNVRDDVTITGKKKMWCEKLLLIIIWQCSQELLKGLSEGLSDGP